MKNKTKSYAAGMIDADGCISVNELVRENKTQYQPHVSISNTSLPLVKWFVSHFGGVWRKASWVHQNGETYRGYEWIIRDQKHIGRFLRLILPYLILKRSQAESMLEYVSLFGEWDPESRIKLFKRIRSLKRERVTTDTSNDLDKKTRKPYFAGFFDGEGSCIIREVVDGYRASVSVGNNPILILDMMKKVFNGNSYPYITASGNLAHSYQIGKKQDIEKFLLAMLPYLIVKRDKALTLLQFVRLDGICPNDRRNLFARIKDTV